MDREVESALSDGGVGNGGEGREGEIGERLFESPENAGFEEEEVALFGVS